MLKKKGVIVPDRPLAHIQKHQPQAKPVVADHSLFSFRIHLFIFHNQQTIFQVVSHTNLKS